MPAKKHSELTDVVDLLSAHGAAVLAEHINSYWAARGRVADAERYEMPGRSDWGVRSKMVNGIPPLAIKQARA